MRIVGGASKGRRLCTPTGLRVRPTSDMVREAVFNMLGAASDFGALYEKVLDLFAGTGAMGLEALSRGANKAVFVDDDRASVNLIKKNVALCGFEERAKIVSKDYASAVALLSGEKFDLIFIDPPYDSGLAPLALSAVVKVGLIAPEGFAIVEASRRSPLASGFEGLKRVAERRYGDTLIYFFTLED